MKHGLNFVWKDFPEAYVVSKNTILFSSEFSIANKDLEKQSVLWSGPIK